jgi:cyclohexanone monooxygenase
MSQTSSDALDVVIVGAGVGGVYAVYKLRQLGLKVRAYEKASDVGGTWYWNRYPGCRCDVESLEYSFSFSPELDQEWKWPERYGNQGEILTYVRHVADRFDIRNDIQFDTVVTSAVFDEAASRWTLKTDTGETISAPYVIMATGNLSTPRTPDIKGIDTFKGKTYHTGLWPHEGVDFTGLRVGVIGTGSSGVQSVPHLAKQARQLFVFQRTANFSLPAQNGPMDPENEAKHKSEYPQRRADAVNTPFAIAGYPPPTKSALEVSEEERDATYAQKWQEGGSISFLYSYTDLLTNKAANDTAANFVRNKIRQTVKHPETAEALCPNDHPIGTKRLILDTNYYQTYNLSHVKLVNIRKTPIEEITQWGIKTSDGKAFEIDAIVFATGFDAMTGAIKEIDVRGKGGLSINEKWKDGPQTYMGVMVAGFPNMFMVTGPQSPGVKSQMIFSCQQHVDFIGDIIACARGRRMRRIEASRTAEMAWVQHNNEVANSTLYPLANSWYMGANVPGKPRVFMPYVGGVQNYVAKCNEVAAKGYDGFEMSE